VNTALALLDRQPAAQVIIPPHKTAVCSPAGDSQRDNHIRIVDQFGRIAWQKQTGYGLRNYAKLAMQRYKGIFGNTMKARWLPQRKLEAWASAVALNRMTILGMPLSVKIYQRTQMGLYGQNLNYSTTLRLSCFA
jgi:hypothetical protein